MEVRARRSAKQTRFNMSKCNSIERALAICLVGLILWPSTGVVAQQRTTTSPNRAGGGTGVSSGTSSGTTRQYTPNGTVGDAMISVDPETHRVIVITDEETSKYVGQVISNLDRPKPQVLIKVVFLEVTHNNSSDIGLEGSYTKNIGNSYLSGLMTNFFVLTNLTTSGAGTNLSSAISGTTIVPGSISSAQSHASAAASTVFGLGAAGSSPIPPGAGLYQILGQDYQVTLRAIAQAGNAKVLS